MWRQWQKANNYIHSVQTYQDMSPDLSMRHQVNKSLRQHRQPLSPEEWCQEFQQDSPCRAKVLLFIYRSLENHSGIEFNRVRPTDRLVDDLQFPLVCWFDWSASFCDEALEQLGIDIRDCFDETCIYTLTDLATFLETCLTKVST